MIKRLLMFVAAFAIAVTGVMAQDVYTAGTEWNYTTGEGILHIQKNGQDVYTRASDGGRYECTDMIVGGDGCVYFTVNYVNATTQEQRWTDIYKYDPATNQTTQVYNCPVDGTKLNDLVWYNGSIYGAGYYPSDPNTNGRYFNRIVKDDAVLYDDTDAEDDQERGVYGITADPEGNVWTVGGEANSMGSGLDIDGGYYCAYGSIYKNGVFQEYLAGTGTQYSRFNDVVFYNNKLYICGVEHRTSTYATSPWDAVFYTYNITSGTLTKIAQVSNDNSSLNTEFRKICYDARNIYVIGTIAGVEDAVWKYSPGNGLEKIFSFNTPCGSASITANSNGIYCAHNGSRPMLYQEGGTSTIDLDYGHNPTNIAVISPTLTGKEYDLPFYEYFEYGNTTWEEWYKYDGDNNNGLYNSFWERGNVGGDHSDLNATHQFGCKGLQSGDLVSPAINMPAEAIIDLTFLYRNDDPEDLATNEVYVAVRPDPSFVLSAETYNDLIWDKVWENSSETASETWQSASIDLSEYKGQTVYLSFWYQGNCADAWMVDDINIWYQYDGVSEAEENGNAQISVMPNPATTNIRLNGLDKAETISIYNAVGQQVSHIENYIGEEISVEGLSAGIYVIRTEESGQTVKFTVK